MATTSSRTTLIGDISGQDGAHPAKYFLDRSYLVMGTSRNAQVEAIGNLDFHRDWVSAPEFADPVSWMLQQDMRQDYAIATGLARSLKEFFAKTCQILRFDWLEYATGTPSLLRPADRGISCATRASAESTLDWRANTEMRDVVRAMVTAV